MSEIQRIEQLEKTLRETRDYLIETREILLEHLKAHREANERLEAIARRGA